MQRCESHKVASLKKLLKEKHLSLSVGKPKLFCIPVWSKDRREYVLIRIIICYHDMCWRFVFIFMVVHAQFASIVVGKNLMTKL